MAGDLRVQPGVLLPADELVERFSRASGPGGQSVNTTDSRVELRFHLARSPSLPPAAKTRLLDRLGPRLVDGAVVIVASEHRSQYRNREAARGRLVDLLRDALAPGPAPRRPTRPHRGAREERLAGKRRRAEVKRRRGVVRPDD